MNMMNNNRREGGDGKKGRTVLGLISSAREEIYESWHFPLKPNHDADRLATAVTQAE